RRMRDSRSIGRGAALDGETGVRAARLAPALRGALAEVNGEASWRRVILEHRASAEILEILASADAEDLARANPLTPDHVIRTKGPGLLLRAELPLEDPVALREHLSAAVTDYSGAYDAYFEANRGRARAAVTKLDSHPRVIL